LTSKTSLVYLEMIDPSGKGLDPIKHVVRDSILTHVYEIRLKGENSLLSGGENFVLYHGNPKKKV